MTLDRDARARIALTVLVLFSVASGIELTVRSGAHFLRRDGELDRVTQQERRLQPLRARLPSHRLIGYVSDDLADGSFTSLDGMQEYFITQYSLVPTIVVVGTGHELVLGNFTEPSAAGDVPSLVGLSIIEVADNGVVLYGREAR